jgi:hypothetical protein
MPWRGIAMLGRKMARRNHLYLFAWLCALGVPLGLQALAGAIEDIRDYLDMYYGPLSLYMCFTLAYGFASVFVAYYQAGAYRRAGALDLLRLTGATPAQAVLGVYYQIEHVLLPPLLAFLVLFFAYIQFISPDRFLRDAPWWQVLAFALVLLLNQALLAALQLTALFRREETAALVCAVLVLPLNAGMLVFTMILRLPGWAYLALLMAALAGLLALAWRNVRSLWPAQPVEHRV